MIELSYDFFTVKAAAFCALVRLDCKSDDDLFCSKTLNASFFARIASFTSFTKMFFLAFPDHSQLLLTTACNSRSNDC